MGDNAQEPLLARDRREDRHSEDNADGITDYGSGVYRYPRYLQPGQFTSLEKLMFSISSILLIILCLFIGLYARSSFDDRRWPPHHVPVPDPPQTNETENYCLDSHCILSAAHILQDVDIELDPCDDFYAYTCSRWIDDHVIPENRQKINSKTIAEDSIKQRLHRMLLHDLVRSGEPRGLPSPDWIVDQQLFTSLHDFYKSCMNEDLIDRRGIAPLYDLFRTTRRLLPLFQQDREDTSKACVFLGRHNIWPLFSLVISPSDDKFSIKLQPATLSLPSHTYYHDEDTMTTYLDVITQILTLVFQQDTDGEFGWRSWSTVATARRILDFEKSLATISAANEEEHLKERPWSLFDLQELAPAIDWTAVIGALTGRNKDQSTSRPLGIPVMIKDSAHIHGVSRLIEANSPRTLQMYLIWRIIWTYLDTLGEPFVAHKRILEATLNGVQPRAKTPRWETCLGSLDQNLGFLLGRYFVKNFSQTDIRKGEHLSFRVKEEMVRDLNAVTWYTESDRRLAVKKIRQVDLQIGYPLSQPDTRSALEMAKYYGDIAASEDLFFENVLYANKQAIHRQWQRVGEQVNQGEWDITPQRATAKYTHDMNMLVIPAGLLSWPFFSADAPEYLNYGALGWMVGQQIMQALEGRAWSTQMQAEFEERVQCFVRQNEQELQNNISISNTVADSGGLQLAWAAWNRDNGTNPLLPGLGRWTREQLFHIQFGRMGCSKSTPEHLQHAKDHRSERWRVNGPLMNSDSFAQAFQCPIGSRMNPLTKCRVW